MPLTYPATMPTAGAMAIEFGIPQRNDYLSPENSGRIGGVQAGWPRFTLALDLNNMTEPDARLWRVFMRSLRGSQRTFLAHDPWRPYPLEHADGFARMTYIEGAPFGGNAGGWSQAIAANGDAVLTMTGLPAGLRITADDYIGFKWDAAGSPANSWDRRALAVAQEDARAGATGVASFTIEPALPEWVPAGAVAHLDKPQCLMKQLGDQSRLGRKILTDFLEAGSKLVGVQVLLP